jgi:transcriptional regulator with XRE-family HTH domain
MRTNIRGQAIYPELRGFFRPLAERKIQQLSSSRAFHDELGGHLDLSASIVSRILDGNFRPPKVSVAKLVTYFAMSEIEQADFAAILNRAKPVCKYPLSRDYLQEQLETKRHRDTPKKWKTAEIAQALEVDPKTIRRWLGGFILPGEEHNIEKLIKFFNMDESEQVRFRSVLDKSTAAAEDDALIVKGKSLDKLTAVLEFTLREIFKRLPVDQVDTLVKRAVEQAQRPKPRKAKVKGKDGAVIEG